MSHAMTIPQRLHARAARARKVSPYVRIGQVSAVVATVCVLWALGKALNLATRPAAAVASVAVVEPAPTVFEQLSCDGRVVGRWEVKGDVHPMLAGYVAFETTDGQRLFCSGLWRVTKPLPSTR